MLTHGYCLSLRCWVYQRRALKEAGYRVVSWDQRGHGRSGRGERDSYTIDRLGPGPRHRHRRQLVPERDVVLVGHSMGGMTMLALGAAPRVRPRAGRRRRRSSRRAPAGSCWPTAAAAPRSGSLGSARAGRARLASRHAGPSSAGSGASPGTSSTSWSSRTPSPRRCRARWCATPPTFCSARRSTSSTTTSRRSTASTSVDRAARVPARDVLVFNGARGHPHAAVAQRAHRRGHPRRRARRRQRRRARHHARAPRPAQRQQLAHARRPGARGRGPSRSRSSSKPRVRRIVTDVAKNRRSAGSSRRRELARTPARSAAP